ncbi:MAG: Uma2 family endonuclease, partial [Microcystis sp. LE19-388.1G]|nr:Uma2 family endonuclease [Microcystis sp. LE19-388.1G]
MYQSNSPDLVQKPLPTMYDLPSEDPEEPGLPDEFHNFQPQLLRETCQPKTYSGDEIFIGTDINLYPTFRTLSCHREKLRREKIKVSIKINIRSEKRHLRNSKAPKMASKPIL